MKKKILSILLAILITTSMVITSATTVSAASYPLVMHTSVGMQVYCGDTVPLIKLI